MLLAIASEIINTGVSSSDILERYKGWIAHVKELKLWEAQNFKAMINGDEIQTLLGIKKGPLMKVVTDKQVEWLYENPEGTKEELIEYLKVQKFE